MRHHRHSSCLWLVVLLTGLGPLLSACTVVTPSPEVANSLTPLPQVVEAYMADLPGPSPKLFLTTRVYDRQGTFLGEFWNEGKRYWVPLERISPTVRQATIATEDKSFYTNPGIDWAAIARAVLQNSGEGEVISGASTITQQLARNIAMPYERRLEQTLDRKLSESTLAQDLTLRFSKDQILEMYLNVVYYGHVAYGIEAAARTFFAKSAASMTLAESALLAALPQAPAALDPYEKENLPKLKARQGLVLALMVRNGYIKAKEAEAAYAEPLNFRSEQPASAAPHFLQYVHDYLAGQYGGDMLDRGGFTVITSLDLRIQSKAEQIVRQQVAAIRDKYNLTNAALVALKPGSGEIIAMVGSADFANKAIDGQVNVTISRRQPGSAIKPILYSLAFTEGMTPADLIWDTAVSFPLGPGRTYRPTNYDGKFHGAVRLRQALANSYNVPAVKLLNLLGVPAMVDMARSFGVTTLDRPVEQYGLSLTLGGAELKPIELTAAFATLANAGVLVTPNPILHLTDASKHEIRHFGSPSRVVLDPRVAYMVTSILSDNEARVPAFGANSPLKLSRPVAAKTGTTTDFRDNWTVGYTPYLAVGVWAGNSNGQPMRNTTGLTGAAPIWHDFFEAVFADATLEKVVRNANEPLDFRRPPGLLDAPLCNQVASAGGTVSCSASKRDLFIDPAQPITIGLQARSTNTAAISPTLALTPTVDAAVSPVRGLLYARGQVCTLAEGGELLAAVQPPADSARRQSALRAAAQVGLPIVVGPCTEGMVAMAQEQAAQALITNEEPAAGVSTAQDSPPTAPTLEISYPAPGSIIRGSVSVMGSAVFDRSQYQFYKVEYGYGGRPSDWITIGRGHTSPRSFDQLETWDAGSLPDGIYALRAVLVRQDGNYIVSPSVVVEVTH